MIEKTFSRFKLLFDEVIPFLSKETPEELTYHNVAHTCYVIDKVEVIADYENVPNEYLELIKIAALYHDIGFIYQRENHEEIGCQIVKKRLAELDFSKQEIDMVCSMIMATKIPQKPQNLFDKVLADADLEYLGTVGFESIAHNFYTELKFFDSRIDEKKWLEIQIEFISNHHYHTNFCVQRREPMKQTNLKKLKAIMTLFKLG
jgi:uncharacterized protein